MLNSADGDEKKDICCFDLLKSMHQPIADEFVLCLIILGHKFRSTQDVVVFTLGSYWLMAPHVNKGISYVLNMLLTLTFDI